MTSRIQKRLLLPKRVRHPPREGFSWVDRRFLKDYAARLSRDAILLYFFSLLPAISTGCPSTATPQSPCV